MHGTGYEGQVALTRFCDSQCRVGLFNLPDFDMSGADRNKSIAHPSDSIDVADALVTGVECCGACARVDAPDIQEAIVGRA